ncbi:Tetraspanin-5, partial [Homalodisca vitripennis]
EIIKNKQCGYDVRKPGYFADGWTNLSPAQSGEHNIFERGCWRAGEEWVEHNLVPLLVVLVGSVVVQNYDVSKIIYEKGCLQAGEEWIERNLLNISTLGLVITFLQVSLQGILSLGSASRRTCVPTSSRRSPSGTDSSGYPQPSSPSRVEASETSIFTSPIALIFIHPHRAFSRKQPISS